MSEQKHTPTPWLAREDDGNLTTGGKHDFVKITSPWIEGAFEDDPEAIANMRFIAKAVNAHDALVKALERAITYIELTYDEEMGEEAAEAKHDLDMARSALSLAKGTTSNG